MKIVPKELNDNEKNKKTDFTRNRVLTTSVIVMIVMNLVKDRNTKGYEITMNQFWSESKRYNIELPADKPPTKSAFSLARNKIKALLFKQMLKKTVNEFELIYGDKYVWKGHRVFAVDGTKYTLPASDELIKRYGCHNCGEKESHYPQATVSVLFNVKSKVAYEIEINKVKSNEREELKKICKSLFLNDLVILDRGYPSYEILGILLKNRIEFIIRVPSSFTFKAVEDFIKEEIGDKIIDMTVNKKEVKIRAIKTKIGDGEYKVLITSLLDQNKYSYEDICSLYEERWEIEEHYKANKELFKVENFHSKNENGILQEIYSQLLLSNITRMMMNEAEKDNEESKEDNPSFKNAVYTVERYLNEITLCGDKAIINTLYERMLEEIRRVRYKKILDRHYPRRSFKAFNKWKKSLT